MHEINMARQPQVVTAVIRPCNSPVPKETRRHCLARHAFVHAKSTSSMPAQQKQAMPQPNSVASVKGNYTKPTACTLLKSRCSSAVSSIGRSSKSSQARAAVGLQERKIKVSNASTPTVAWKARNPQHSGAARGGKTSSSGNSQRTETAAFSTANSTRQCNTPVSFNNVSPIKSASLATRTPQASSAIRKPSGTSAASTRTGRPVLTSASSVSGRRYRSPSPLAASGRPLSPHRPGRPASHEARPNQLNGHIDHLQRISPQITSPEFTSTRTNLVRRSRSPSPEQARTADTSPWHLTGNSAVLFAPSRQPDSRPRSRSRSWSRSRSRSRSPGGARPSITGRGVDTTTWVETRNRAPAMGVAEREAAHASPPPTWQARRHLPRVSYPRPSPATRLRAHSSSSQTRRPVSREERVTLRSRDGSGRTPGPNARAVPHRSARTPATPRGPTRAAASPRQPARTTPSSRRPARTGAGRAAAPSTIDYSPQSHYMSELLRRGAVRRPVGRENRRPAGPESGHHGSRRQPGRRLSAASQRSAASEPAQSAQKPARSILRTSASVNRAACDPAARYYGYGWVSDMLDLSAPLPKSRKDVQSVRRFRDENWSDTHGRTGTGRGASGDSRSSGSQRDKHKCVHEYYINSRLFPTPLYTDSKGRSQCPVCLAVGPSPAGRRSRSLSLSPGLDRRGTRSRSRSPVPSRQASLSSPARRARPRTPTGARQGRPRSRSAVAPRRPASPARRRSSVSWQDEVALAGCRPERGRTGGAGRSRSPAGPVCVTCPNCHHRLSVSAAEPSEPLSDSLEPPRGRPAARGPAPAPGPSPPRRLESPRCAGEEEPQSGQRRSPAAPAGRTRSPVTLRSRASRQPVKAMFTVPAALFGDARQQCGSCPSAGGPTDWGSAGSVADLSRRAGHPLWPRQLELSPSRVTPIARGWPQYESRGNLGRPADRLERAATAQLRAGRNPAPRRSVQTGGGSTRAGNTYSLRRCIGEKI